MPSIPGLTEPRPPTLPSYVAYGRQAVPQVFYAPPAQDHSWEPRTPQWLTNQLVGEQHANAATLRGLGAAPSTWGYVGVAAAVAVIGAGVLATVYAERMRPRPRKASSRRARAAATRRRRRRARRS